jgi:hypothetical protein
MMKVYIGYLSSPENHCTRMLSLVKAPIALKLLNVRFSNLPKEPQ